MAWQKVKLSAARVWLRIRRLASVSAPLPTLTTITTQFPVLIPLRELYNKLLQMANKYDIYRTLTEIDPELYGAINRLALMVKKSYRGVGVFVGRELDDKEKQLLKIVRDFENQWDLPQVFYSVAFNLIRDGDDIWAIKLGDEAGLTEWKPLPIPYVTIVGKEDQMNNPAAQVFERNIYVLNETSEPLGMGEGIRQTWMKDEIVQFSLNNKAQIVYDSLNRFTFGVWSMSPVEPLKARLQWKLAVLINDILLRQKLVPREHHKLDLSAFDPAFYAGATVEERYGAAKAAAEKHIIDYKTNVTEPLREVDKSYITGKKTEIEYVEPKHVTYIDPNPLMDQISRSIIAAVGIGEAAAMGRGRGTFATELVVASYSILAAEALADIIKRQVVNLIRKSIRKKYKNEFTDEDLQKIDIRILLVLGLEKGEAARRAAIMEATGIATLDELRDEIGLTRALTRDERQELIEKRITGRGRRIADRTLEDIISDYVRRKEEPTPETPESEAQRKKT